VSSSSSPSSLSIKDGMRPNLGMAKPVKVDRRKRTSTDKRVYSEERRKYRENKNYSTAHRFFMTKLRSVEVHWNQHLEKVTTDRPSGRLCIVSILHAS
jgi:hypothetical protein